jgi:carbamoyl-phosphate synthase large subunit
MAAGCPLPVRGTVFVSVNDRDKGPIVPVGQQLAAMGFQLVATAGTGEALRRAGVTVRGVLKLSEGRPNIADMIANRELALIINTPTRRGPTSDEGRIRALATLHQVSIVTTMTGAEAAVEGIAALRAGLAGGSDADASWTVHPLQEYFPTEAPPTA